MTPPTAAEDGMEEAGKGAGLRAREGSWSMYDHPGFLRARNLIQLQHGGETLSQDADKWLTDYMLACPVAHVVELHKIMDMLDDDE